MDPANLRFNATHEWASLNDGVATIGISDFAVRELTDIVHIELPSIGKTIKAGEVFGEIESVKAVSDLYSPLSGEIIEVNQQLESGLDHLSDDPFEKGWIIKIKASQPEELDQLLTYEAYQQECQNH